MTVPNGNAPASGADALASKFSEFIDLLAREKSGTVDRLPDT